MEIITIVLRGAHALPGVTLNFDAFRKESVRALDVAFKQKKTVLLLTQLDDQIEEIKKENLPEYGVLGTIEHLSFLGHGGLRIAVSCKERAEFIRIVGNKPYILSEAQIAPAEEDSAYDVQIIDAMKLVIKDLLRDHAQVNDEFASVSLDSLIENHSLSTLIYSSAAMIPFEKEVRQTILHLHSLEERYEFLCNSLIKETGLFQLKQGLQANLRRNIDRNQREFYIREQIRVLRKELGAEGSMEEEEYAEQIEKLSIKQKYKDKLLKEIEKLKGSPGNAEAHVIRNYLDTVLEIPWKVYTTDNRDMHFAENVLEEDHYGLSKIKERILEYLAVRMLNPSGHGPILCLAGPPGTGKTSIARSVARALGRKYVRLSLGGVRDEAEIRGHRKTYVGAMPGRIVESLRQAGCSNPLMLLDEIDKTSGDHRGDLSSSLLEVLDSEQNKSFRDHYLEIPLDLSQVLFIATANDVEHIPAPLKDRMEIIPVSSYTENEKFHIAHDYLVRHQISENGLNEKEVEFTDDALRHLIHHYTREAGVRQLNRTIGDICRKCAKQVLDEVGAEILPPLPSPNDAEISDKEAASKKAPKKTATIKRRIKKKIRITEKNIAEYLGKPKFHSEKADEPNEVGVVRGLAWTRVGGDTLSIEVNVLAGKGGILLTGRMGDVMKESARIALSYVRSIAGEYGIQPEFFESHEMHIHIPEGSVPKDGPSAGITMATAIFSAVTNQKADASVAMTGELTLRGRVLPIGGLKEKILAAKMAEVKTVIVPKANLADIAELDEEIVGGLNICYVQTLKEVLSIAIEQRG